MEHQPQHLVRSHRPHDMNLMYDPAYLSQALPQDLHPMTPSMYMPVQYSVFESPGLGLTSEHSTPCRFGDVFQNEHEVFQSPWLDAYYPPLEDRFDPRLDHRFDPRFDPRFEPQFEARFDRSVESPSGQICQWADCHEAFRSMEDMIRHVVDNHIGSGKSSYACMWRGCKRGSKAFPKRHKMLNHFRTHTGEKPFQCRFPTCQKSFSRPDSLATHVKTHSEVRPYACPLPTCGRKYYHSRSLRKHLAAHQSRPNPYHPVIQPASQTTLKPTS
ncbi:hypothetical protein DSO57_1037345 [Entomophthora muscae]|nr:hypothetical protein DSO57_1037345 [Entomophthora muscae]